LGGRRQKKDFQTKTKKKKKKKQKKKKKTNKNPSMVMETQKQNGRFRKAVSFFRGANTLQTSGKEIRTPRDGRWQER